MLPVRESVISGAVACDKPTKQSAFTQTFLQPPFRIRRKDLAPGADSLMLTPPLSGMSCVEVPFVGYMT
jgi:hypothetical protein